MNKENIPAIAEEIKLAITQATTAKDEEIKRLREEHTMQLAAISTASISNTEATLKEVQNCHKDYQSTAFWDVIKAIQREMQHRNDLAAKDMHAGVGCKTFVQPKENNDKQKYGIHI